MDAETEEVLNEFSFLGSDTEDASHELRMQSDTTDWGIVVWWFPFWATPFLLSVFSVSGMMVDPAFVLLIWRAEFFFLLLLFLSSQLIFGPCFFMWWKARPKAFLSQLFRLPSMCTLRLERQYLRYRYPLYSLRCTSSNHPSTPVIEIAFFSFSLLFRVIAFCFW